MIFPRLAAALFLAVVVPFTALAAPKRSAPTRPASPDNATAYKGAIILDAATGGVLFEDRADEVSPPASMTKLMTFAVLHDKLAAGALTLATPVKVTNADAAIGGTQVYLDPRETFPVEELIYAMMIQSANDAAYALARTAGGSVDAFVELMNAKARELGMTHTTFRSPHGLPPASRRIADGDLTTPRDFAALCRYLITQTDVLKYTSVRMRKFGEGVRAKPMDMVNHDHLIGHVEGVDGLKTGFTNGAGFCLSATALRRNHRVIVVVMGSPDSKTRDLKVTEFIDRGFAALPPMSPEFTTAGAASATATPAAPSPVTPAPIKAAAPSTAPASDGSPSVRFSLPGAKK
jgi:D-alanyl-D-alanine carboxypeptidase (penicillin-binding protein 5/6)